MAGKGSTKDDNQSSGGSRKTTTTTTTNTPAKPQEQQVIIKCPRCDSQNTKFCYYNNYSLTQPRHFCKTCRRYWTNGGALRNVPIGGGCRKNKKLKTSSSRLSFDSSTSTRSISSSHHELQLGGGGGGGLQFFQGISPPVDFQGLNLYNNNHQMNIIPSFGDIHLTNSSASNQNPSCFNLLEPSSALPATSSNIINFPFSSTQENYKTNLASSIESLSSINQDLHWKLQQQRLAMLFGGGGCGETCTQKDSHSRGFSSSTSLANQIQKPQPILFHNLEGGSNKEGGNNNNNNNNNNLCGGGGGDHLNSRKEVGNLATEWFFDPTPTSSNNGGNENVVTGSWNDIQAWTNLNQYTSLP